MISTTRTAAGVSVPDGDQVLEAAGDLVQRMVIWFRGWGSGSGSGWGSGSGTGGWGVAHGVAKEADGELMLGWKRPDLPLAVHLEEHPSLDLVQVAVSSADQQVVLLLPVQSVAKYPEAHREADFSQDHLQAADSLAVVPDLQVQVLLQAAPLPVDLQTVLLLPVQSTVQFPVAHQEADFSQDQLQAADSLAAVLLLPLKVLLQAVPLPVDPLVLEESLAAASAFQAAVLAELDAEESVKVSVK
ncbi:hypothetical protein DPMN_152038 [Dreissena polymorpha]|uniref:Uncharacterized protein n=1 Tax=Dreissena polymorpha TaxID=45954 RepID=A0A9D4J719_DREPO|nr:hypothetical protein DPMN_152038 [Dreissena polymorpha]